jgi:hypothetical protein
LRSSEIAAHFQLLTQEHEKHTARNREFSVDIFRQSMILARIFPFCAHDRSVTNGKSMGKIREKVGKSLELRSNLPDISFSLH